jgi:hypothetical protein
MAYLHYQSGLKDAKIRLSLKMFTLEAISKRST